MNMDGNNQEIEIPEYFICPISLQIMKDPVTTVTGITYDRESIEKWLASASEDTTTCPITKQSLSRDSDLTPNHMLRRIIQAWCTANSKYGIDRIPTPKSPLNKSHILKLIRDLNIPESCNVALNRLSQLVSENERNRKVLSDAGVNRGIILMILKRFNQSKTDGLEEALRIFDLMWFPTPENKRHVKDNIELVKSILWVLKKTEKTENFVNIQTHAMRVMKHITESSSSSLLERLEPELFSQLVKVLSDKTSSPQAKKPALQILIDVCPLGRNRMKIIEAEAIFELLELELSQPEKRITELIFTLLAQLCSCADGRAQLLSHAGAVAVVSKRTLRVSPATDDRAVHILGLIAKYSATNEVLLEMLRVGAVSKLCMILQANCDGYLKKQAREILRLHSNVWNKSPCIQIYLLTRYAR